MTSILTNGSATIALQTLRAINGELDATNRRLSTGQRIGSAADGAAYWAIAATLRGDNGSLSAVTDAMNLDRNAVEAAYAGLTMVVDALGAMSRSLVAAKSEQVDRAKIQLDIVTAQKAMRTFAEGAVMNGNNWLSVRSDTPGFAVETSLVAAFSRQGGTATVSTFALDTSGFILFDNKPRVVAPSDWVEPSNTPALPQMTAIVASIAASVSATSDPSLRLTYFDTPTHTHNHGLLDSAYLFTPPGVSRARDSFSIQSLDITPDYVTTGMIDVYLKVVDATMQKLIAGASVLGASAKLLESQQTFAKQLMDINTSSIGSLVDADVEEESMRLRALQTQQQLGIQALSIANTRGQTLLSLFR
ncbi:flagellin [uncultured Methylobacterium sp.]|jgi:flagellin|uniref:flagellin N-terminal helical domain-containing protein n=1 Tax=uncultured Methylobacterium sp. TaxID=157278 RepID=UPI00262FB172|nr:flagellin [uncultured Methylobacterium sp.]